jgi:hypothetical protein
MILIPSKNIMPDMDILKRKLHIKRPLELKRLESVIDRASKDLKPQYAFKKIVFKNEAKILSQIQSSKSLKEAIGEAQEAFIVICTLGDGVCEQLREYQNNGDMVSAIYLDRFLSDAVENLAEYSSLGLLERFYDENYVLGQRFSPGYGDLKLDFQKIIFSFFEEKEITVKINSKNFMIPEKSISYIVAVKKLCQ